jgi:NAD(P)-dependent dehydrogenase (short-subunit alcohol dehydrogenase family)
MNRGGESPSSPAPARGWVVQSRSGCPGTDWHASLRAAAESWWSRRRPSAPRMGGAAIAAAADVATEEGREAIVHACEEQFGRLDVIVNNAATSAIGPFLDQSVEDWHTVFRTNVEAIFFLTSLGVARGVRDQRSSGRARDRVRPVRDPRCRPACLPTPRSPWRVSAGRSRSARCSPPSSSGGSCGASTR